MLGSLLAALSSPACSSATEGFGTDGGSGGQAGSAGTGGSGGDSRVDAGADAGEQRTDASNDGAVADKSLFGIAADTDIQTVSAEQKGKLCDWMNEQLGGYGMSFACKGAGSVTTAKDQAECIAGVFTGRCVLSLEQFVTCVRALAPEHTCNAEYNTCLPLYECYSKK